jgi:hypothetical protein
MADIPEADAPNSLITDHAMPRHTGHRRIVGDRSLTQRRAARLGGSGYL